jgi:hypothetical protein
MSQWEYLVVIIIVVFFVLVCYRLIEEGKRNKNLKKIMISY